MSVSRLKSRFNAAAVILWYALAATCQAQYIISTVAGGALTPTPVSATATAIEIPQAVAVDPSGNRYFIGTDAVFEISSGGLLTLFAGSVTTTGYGGDGGLAVDALLREPGGLAVDYAGNVYIADSGNARIRKVAVNGTISTVAGTGAFGYSGDGGPATGAELNDPTGVAVDWVGNLYIADCINNRIRKVAAENGVISTVAGDGTYGYFGDGAAAVGAELAQPRGVALDSLGNVYIADTNNYRIRVVGVNGVISTVAGDGTYGYSGDTGPATGAEISTVTSIAIDSQGDLYLADLNNDRIREVVGGKISTFAGNGVNGFLGDGGPSTAAEINYPEGIGLDSNGNLYICDSNNHRVREVAGGTISTIAGLSANNYFGDGGPATGAGLGFPNAVVADAAGNLYIADSGNARIRKVALNGTIATFAGNGNHGYGGDGGPATSAVLNFPTGLAIDAAGNIYIADSANARIREVTLNGNITTVAGNGNYGFSGDSGPATGAELAFPEGVAVDPAGDTIYIADTQNARIRMVAPNGNISTIAGNGTQGYGGDDGPATGAELNSPLELALDSAGDLYIADTNNSRIRMIAANGMISTVAGNGSAGYSGDNGPATSAEINGPVGVAIDSKGNLYIADTNNVRIRKVTGGTISSIAGMGAFGYSGDGGASNNAEMGEPSGLFVASSGTVYFPDLSFGVIRELVPQSAAALLTITSAQTGIFSAGQSGAGYSIQVSNDALAGPTAGTVTVVELLPAGLSLVSMSGSGWSCASNTCSRSDVLAAGSGYPAITVVVDVAGDAPASLTNQATVSGGGSFPASASGLTGVVCATPNPVSISVDASGGGPQILNLTAASPSCIWSASTNFGGWLGLSPSSGTGSGTLTATIAPNSTGQDRSAVITLGTATVSVTEDFTTAVFADVTPAEYYFDAVDLMSTHNITAGCSTTPFDYCPTQQIDRAEMAIFIVRAVYNGSNSFPYSPTPHFSDVPANYFAFAWIQAMYELGITTGCGNGMFCPTDTVTRGEMAVFIIRARYGSNTAFTSPSTPYFSDVPASNVFFTYIQRMREDNITAGCSATNYCPNSPVIRGDMAIFVMRGAFNQLLPPGEPVIASIVPGTLTAGSSATYTVTGMYTNFVQGTTTIVPVDAGAVTASNITVTSPTTLTVTLTATSGASQQPVSIYVQTEPQEAVLPNGLTVQ
jgi:sugar lactone lactonase YvrE